MRFVSLISSEIGLQQENTHILLEVHLPTEVNSNCASKHPRVILDEP